MFGFGPMSSFYDEDFENDYNPVEPFSQDEFVAHNDRELRNLDAGREDWDDGEDDDEDYDDLGRVYTNFGTVLRIPRYSGEYPSAVMGRTELASHS